MITIMETKKIVNNKQLVDIACLSTDTKPTTGIMNGSMLIETDTGKVCIYNEADGEWTEIGSGGGGGGTSDFSTANVTVITPEGATLIKLSGNIGENTAGYGFIQAEDNFENIISSVTPPEGTVVAKAILMKNFDKSEYPYDFVAVYSVISGLIASAEGSCDVLGSAGEQMVIIWGDCTLNVNNK